MPNCCWFEVLQTAESICQVSSYLDNLPVFLRVSELAASVESAEGEKASLQILTTVHRLIKDTWEVTQLLGLSSYHSW